MLSAIPFHIQLSPSLPVFAHMCAATEKRQVTHNLFYFSHVLCIPRVYTVFVISFNSSLLYPFTFSVLKSFHLFVCWLKFDTFFFLYIISSDSVLRLEYSFLAFAIHSNLPYKRALLVFADSSNAGVCVSLLLCQQ